MKKLILILFVLTSLILKANTYYFASAGSDNNPGTQAQPFATVAKFNSLKLASTDQVYFNRGDVFYGTLNPNGSGTAASPILISAYGTGADPVITGFTTLSAWTSLGNNLYSSKASGGNMVVVDGKFQVMGKLPKGNTGYYTINSTGTNSITSSALNGAYFGEIVWRPNTWVLWRGAINSISGQTVSFTPIISTSGGDPIKPVAGYGFFFQNSASYCTQNGEWAYGSGALTIYLSDGQASHVVQVSTGQSCVTISSRSFIVFDGLSFTGANVDIVDLLTSKNITFQNCSILYGGVQGVFGNETSQNITIKNCLIDHINSNGIRGAKNASGWVITGNKISNIGAVAGMGGTGEGQYFGIKFDNADGNGDNSQITYNDIDSCGYIPVMFNGKNSLVQNNYIDTYGFVKDDVAGIYADISNLSGSKIDHNIVLNGKGQPIGGNHSDYRAFGIYLDDGANNCEISNNTIAGMGRAGIYVHNGHELNIHDNLMFDNHEAGSEYYNDKSTIAGISYNNNTVLAKGSEEAFNSSTAPTFFSSLDGNIYAKAGNDNNLFQAANSFYTFSAWKTLTKKDAASKFVSTDTAQVFLFNSSAVAKTYNYAGTDLKGTDYSSVTLQPYSAIVLIKPVTGTPPPTNYFNSGQSKSFVKVCTSGIGSAVVYSVPAKTYSSTVSQAAADALATADIAANGQTYANAKGTCTVTTPTVYESKAQSKSFTRNNCGSGYTGSAVTYSVAAGKYQSTLSQAAADGLATSEINSNGQANANSKGTCIKNSCSWWNKLFHRCK